MTATAIYGLVLSGGRSSRMGVDKSALDYHGKPQIAYMMDLLRGFCKHVFVSTRKDQPCNEAFDCLPDRFEVAGPMNGVLSALTAHPYHAWLIVAVDMPNIGEEAIEQLIGNRDASRLATCFFNPVENLPEPLLAIWEPAALTSLLKFVEAGNNSPREFLRASDVRLIDVQDPSILLNINSPDEYRKFRNAKGD